ncbi:MAG: ParB/RepB/Spo0J family partition protein [Rhizobium sp.]|nr:MAG: ParB/RepB/Spo0J family partition protein [Rhizobium sp.]
MKPKTTKLASGFASVFAGLNQTPSPAASTVAPPAKTLFLADLEPAKMDEMRRSGEILDLPLNSISPDPNQPRKTFDKDELASLQGTIEARGVLQPITVRPDPLKKDHYIIIMGERRWRASLAAGKETIPAVVRYAELTEREILAAQLIENADSQRSGVPVWEEAKKLQVFIEKYGYTQIRMATEMGLKQPWINKRVKLLELPDYIFEVLQKSIADMDCANALRRLDSIDPEKAKAIVKKGLEQGAIERGEVLSALRAHKRMKAFAQSAPPTPAELLAQLGVSKPFLEAGLGKASGGRVKDIRVEPSKDAQGAVRVSFELADYLALRSLLDALKVRMK